MQGIQITAETDWSGIIRRDIHEYNIVKSRILPDDLDEFFFIAICVNAVLKCQFMQDRI